MGGGGEEGGEVGWPGRRSLVCAPQPHRPSSPPPRPGCILPVLLRSTKVDTSKVDVLRNDMTPLKLHAITRSSNQLATTTCPPSKVAYTCRMDLRAAISNSVSVTKTEGWTIDVRAGWVLPA